MRNYIKLINARVAIYVSGAFYTERFFIVEDDEDLAEKRDALYAFYSGFFPVDWPPVVEKRSLYFKMTKANVVRALNSDSPTENGLPGQMWQLWQNPPGPWIDFLRAKFVEKSPRKKGRHF